MCNPGIRARHWKAMSGIIGFDITPDSGSTLRKVLKFNLKPYMDEFEGISAGASKVSKKKKKTPKSLKFTLFYKLYPSLFGVRIEEICLSVVC